MKNNEKDFDAVKMMRDIRSQLHEEYERDPKKRKADLERIRKKYMKTTISR